MAKETPSEAIIALHHISPKIEFRNNTAHTLPCTNKEMEPPDNPKQRGNRASSSGLGLEPECLGSNPSIQQDLRQGI